MKYYVTSTLTNHRTIWVFFFLQFTSFDLWHDLKWIIHKIIYGHNIDRKLGFLLWKMIGSSVSAMKLKCSCVIPSTCQQRHVNLIRTFAIQTTQYFFFSGIQRNRIDLVGAQVKQNGLNRIFSVNNEKLTLVMGIV